MSAEAMEVSIAITTYKCSSIKYPMSSTLCFECFPTAKSKKAYNAALFGSIVEVLCPLNLLISLCNFQHLSILPLYSVSWVWK